jgi:hypothetical protein
VFKLAGVGPIPSIDIVKSNSTFEPRCCFRLLSNLEFMFQIPFSISRIIAFGIEGFRREN